jgi:hypothetical protein
MDPLLLLPETQDADPLVEYTDEFGRTRLVPRSEVPRGTAAQGDAGELVDECVLSPSVSWR